MAFDFTNGFHDTANAMATSIATGALKPRTAVLISGVLNVAVVGRPDPRVVGAAATLLEAGEDDTP